MFFPLCSLWIWSTVREPPHWTWWVSADFTGGQLWHPLLKGTGVSLLSPRSMSGKQESSSDFLPLFRSPQESVFELVMGSAICTVSEVWFFFPMCKVSTSRFGPLAAFKPGAVVLPLPPMQAHPQIPCLFPLLVFFSQVRLRPPTFLNLFVHDIFVLSSLLAFFTDENWAVFVLYGPLLPMGRPLF